MNCCVTLLAEQNGEPIGPSIPQSEFVKQVIGSLVQKLLGVPGEWQMSWVVLLLSLQSAFVEQTITGQLTKTCLCARLLERFESFEIIASTEML